MVSETNIANILDIQSRMLTKVEHYMQISERDAIVLSHIIEIGESDDEWQEQRGGPRGIRSRKGLRKLLNGGTEE